MTVDPAGRDVTRLQEMTARLAAGAPDPLKEFFAFLEESEEDALILIAYICNPKKPPAVPARGDIEAGFLLYWIHYPPPPLAKFLSENKLLDDLFKGLQLLAPPTRITNAQYDQLMIEIGEYGEPWTDGTLMGTNVYQQLDERWIIAALNYVWNVLDHGAIKPFPKRTPGNVILTRKDCKTDCDPVLGIVGDWGTGYYKEWLTIDCPAKRVMDQMTGPASPPIDYLIHLGDVYYAGTDWRPEPFEEQNNFYALWPDQGAGRNFTLNSNHEMYGAASGYFDVALQPGGTFVTQNGMSYFAMHYGPWLVLGLDSAYYSDQGNATPEHPRHFYMAGAIGTPVHDQQINWLQQFRSHQGPIMVMTHHDPCDLTGSQTNLLYEQVLQALQRPPTLWYWGHVHNAIVYEHLYNAGMGPPVPTLGRCCGHGAIPFGNGWGLEDGQGNNLPNIVYYAHTPDDALPHTSGPCPANPRVKNGYALVTLHQDGGFSEAFYETGDTQPIYQRTWAAGELDLPIATEPPPVIPA
jgi:hypothetical protein